MATSFKILYVSPEVAPFAKTGGLADVASALPKAIKDLNHDIRVFMPRYTTVKERKFILRDVIRLRNLKIPHAGAIENIHIKVSFLPNSKVQIYFLDYPPYFNRKEFYVDPKTGVDYLDNAERFSMFCRSVIEMLKHLHWQPNIIHCNDWQSGMIPAYLKTIYANENFFQKIKTIFTIHNLAYQGNFSSDKLKITGLPDDLFFPGSPIEFYGKLSFIKTGLEFSDLITAVSPTYAKEIQESDEYGCGMQEILRRRTNDIYGILNGVDYSEWSPDIDDHISEKYDIKSIANKENNKKQLLKLCNLDYDFNVPCIGSISRFADQKGFDLIVKEIEELMRLDFRYIILGKGENKYHTFFKSAQKKYPSKLFVNLQFDNSFAHLLEAGCDMFLMPSKYEPCGLNQLYSLKYGTIPIVRATGGLVDTVVDFPTYPNNGTGFSFKEYDSKEMVKAIRSAIETYKNKDVWKKIIKRAMQQDFSWNKSSREYIKLYSKLVRKK